MTIQTVIFDLGNVLVFFSFSKMVGQLSACTGLKPGPIQELLHEWQGAYEMGALTNEELYQIFLKASNRSFTSQAFFQAASDIFCLNQSMIPILHTLKKKVRLLLLSNTSQAHFEFLLPRTPSLQLFDDFILSYQVGSAKPDPRIFAEALKRANCPPQNCFYTDDVPEYTAAARLQGIDAEVFNGSDLLKKQLRSRRLL